MTNAGELYLSQNYPNPFNPVTRLEYYIPKSAVVKLIVSDILGREVAVVVSGTKPPGSYKVDFDGRNLPGGIYFYHLTVGEFISTKKMTLIK